jgi:putative addiction module CopG family antidote
MNISLPERMKAFVDSQIAQGRYSSVSEYVRDLIKDDERRKAEEQLEALLLKGDARREIRADATGLRGYSPRRARTAQVPEALSAWDGFTSELPQSWT